MRDISNDYTVIGPDGIPTSEETYGSFDEAKKAIVDFVERFRQQGYYRDADGMTIPLDQIAARCRIVGGP